MINYFPAIKLIVDTVILETWTKQIPFNRREVCCSSLILNILFLPMNLSQPEHSN